MVFGLLKAVTDLDPTGMTSKVVDTAELVTDVAVGGVTMVARTGYEAVTDPVGTTEAVVDVIGGLSGTVSGLAHGAVSGAHITLGGMDLAIDSDAAATMLYNALIPQVAQAILGGRLPTVADVEKDAVAWIGGPLEGIYVAANSDSAKLIKDGEAPSAEQLGKDMIAALTPVALAKLGL